jgi:hypothetical protein
MLLKQPVDPVEPGFAQVVPETLDLSFEAKRRGHIVIYGYDMDSKDHNGHVPKFFLVAADGRRLPLEEKRVGRTTHYQITLDVSGSDFEKKLRANDIRKIVCSWNGRNEVLSPKEYSEKQSDLSKILVTGRDPQRRVVRVPIGAISYTPRHTGGDADFCTKDGKPMHVRVIGQTRVNGNRIEARVFMWAEEHVPDHTTVEGWSRDVILRYEERNLGFFKARVPVYGEGPWQTAYTAPKGWVIKSATPSGQTEHRDAIIGHGERDYNKAAGEVVSRFKVWGDRDGDEAGTWTRVEVHFNAVTVELEEVIP